MFLKLKLRAIRSWIRVSSVYLISLPIRVLLLISRSNYVFSNNTTSKIDGAGAQIQRLLGIYSLSKKFGIQFKQNSFTDISVHPLDPYQTKESKVDFVKELNYLFSVRESSVAEPTKIIEISTLRAFRLLKIIVLNLRRPGLIMLNIIEPYPISDAFPDLFLGIRDNFPNWIDFANKLTNNHRRPLISIHYRQGVGGAAIYPGQKISRELPPEYFLEKLRKNFEAGKFAVAINLFTDAPIGDIIYSPVSEQHSHWQGTPGFADGMMKVKGNNLYAFFKSNNVPVDVHIGGNPLEAMAIMSNSDFLVTSRSSLSYVAGLLNSNGTIIAAEGFWHPAPSSWE